MILKIHSKNRNSLLSFSVHWRGKRQTLAHRQEIQGRRHPDQRHVLRTPRLVPLFCFLYQTFLSNVGISVIERGAMVSL